MSWGRPDGCHEHHRCFYCDQPLSPRHEHDHYPVPASCGGVETVPACINCHDLKDRVAVEDWPSDTRWLAIYDVLHAAIPPGSARLFFAKWLRWFFENERDAENGRLCNLARSIVGLARTMDEADSENMRLGKVWVDAEGEEKERAAEAHDAAHQAWDAARQRLRDALAEYDAHPAVKAAKAG
jgi:hypothetical protein